MRCGSTTRPSGTSSATRATPPDVAELVRAALELAITGARDHATQARTAHELTIGRQIQRSLLPGRFPEVPGWRFAADYEPAREVGGDLYDVFKLRGDRDNASSRDDVVVLLIADVTGKGVPAALLMADTKALLHAAADNATGPGDALTRVNRILALERRSSLFVTASLAQVDVHTGNVRIANAGHEAPLVIRTDGRVETLDASGSILGMFGDAATRRATARSAPARRRSSTPTASPRPATPTAPSTASPGCARSWADSPAPRRTRYAGPWSRTSPSSAPAPTPTTTSRSWSSSASADPPAVSRRGAPRRGARRRWRRRCRSGPGGTSCGTRCRGRRSPGGSSPG